MERIEGDIHKEAESLVLRAVAAELYKGFVEIVETEGKDFVENSFFGALVSRLFIQPKKRYERSVLIGDRKVSVIIGSLSVKLPRRTNLLRIYVGATIPEKDAFLQITPEGDAFWFYPGSGVSHDTPLLKDLERFKETLYFLQQENPKSL